MNIANYIQEINKANIAEASDQWELAKSYKIVLVNLIGIVATVYGVRFNSLEEAAAKLVEYSKANKIEQIQQMAETVEISVNTCNRIIVHGVELPFEVLMMLGEVILELKEEVKQLLSMVCNRN